MTKAWFDILDKQEELNSSKLEYFKDYDLNTISEDIKETLNNIKFRNISWQLFEKLDIKFLKNNLHDFVELAVNGTPNDIGFSKNIVLKINNNNELKKKISNIIESILLNIKIDNGYEDYLYRNIAQLLYELEYKEELKLFIEKYCKNSDNEDIQEIYEDYKE